MLKISSGPNFLPRDRVINVKNFDQIYDQSELY